MDETRIGFREVAIEAARILGPELDRTVIDFCPTDEQRAILERFVAEAESPRGDDPDAARFLAREWRDKAEEYRAERDALASRLAVLEGAETVWPDFGNADGGPEASTSFEQRPPARVLAEIRSLVAEWKTRVGYPPRRIHLTLRAAIALGDETLPGSGSDPFEHERHRGIREALVRCGEAGTLDGIPVTVHEEGSADIWLSSFTDG